MNSGQSPPVLRFWRNCPSVEMNRENQAGNAAIIAGFFNESGSRFCHREEGWFGLKGKLGLFAALPRDNDLSVSYLVACFDGRADYS
jgi:hypothetical protein